MKLRLMIAALLALGAAACEREAASVLPTEGVIRLSEQFTGAFDLIDKNGAAVSDAQFEGKIMLVYFGFTHCPDVCPGDVGVMSATLNALGDEASEVAPLFISVDPVRDTPEALRDYFAFDDRIIALTGSPEAAKAAAEGFKVFSERVDLPNSALEYTIQHQRFFFITDRKGQPEWALVGGAGPQELAPLLRRSINQ